jgi:single-strand DNA-binding protein
MAKGFNKVILMGNLTRDPESRTTPSGQSVTNFSLAVNRTWKGADGQQNEDVSYIDCVAWGKTGEIITQYLGKGRAILVSGRLDQRSWEDKESGGKRSKIEVIVEDFNFVGDGQGGGSDAPRTSSTSTTKSSNKEEARTDNIDDKPIDLSEIPF